MTKKSHSFIKHVCSITAGTDYSLAMGSFTVASISQDTPEVNHTLNIITDGVVLEGVEVFSLQLNWTSGQHVNDLHDTEIIIVDTDGMANSFTAFIRIA